MHFGVVVKLLEAAVEGQVLAEVGPWVERAAFEFFLGLLVLVELFLFFVRRGVEVLVDAGLGLAVGGDLRTEGAFFEGLGLGGG